MVHSFNTDALMDGIPIADGWCKKHQGKIPNQCTPKTT